MKIPRLGVINLQWNPKLFDFLKSWRAFCKKWSIFPLISFQNRNWNFQKDHMFSTLNFSKLANWFFKISFSSWNKKIFIFFCISKNWNLVFDWTIEKEETSKNRNEKEKSSCWEEYLWNEEFKPQNWQILWSFENNFKNKNVENFEFCVFLSFQKQKEEWMNKIAEWVVKGLFFRKNPKRKRRFVRKLELVFGRGSFWFFLFLKNDV